MVEERDFYTHGKLLLTGEYAVLDGALALALPTQKGQQMRVFPSEKEGIYFRSLTQEREIWFEEKLFSSSRNPIAQTLEKIIREAQRLHPNFLKEENVQVETLLEFPRQWGLGSSSTLIAMIAQWAEVNPYLLLWKSFGGSGYDIACAKATSPLLYQLQEEQAKVYPIYYKPSFVSSLFFIYLNKKQNSREGISLYHSIKKNKKALIERITFLTECIYRANNLTDFSSLIKEHETLLSSYLQIPTIKERLFKDFTGELKSLGAWGGDFILAIGECNYVSTYFSEKGFTTIIPFEEMVLLKDKEPILPPNH
ncbi:GYDIA family GHMP kinase [Capnocytophaga sp. G2]|jgi:hypothetical protein|uniref:GYDIA family GHMP kinase n=1 Tax=Capnocytophaga sp. G2 TaxID=3110695 RepID=UPI002B472E1C|nr:GYDIA family GHMP kinase [Capnocytophaga sp. G2]MEB3005436.1 GYDIA family GHMP kinase [Capnocytophaga sp. G2]